MSKQTLKIKENPNTVYLKNYTPPSFLVREANLHFTIGEEDVRVDVQLKMAPNPKVKSSGNEGNSNEENNGTEMFLNGVNLALLNITLNEIPLPENDFKQTKEGLLIAASPALKEAFTLNYSVRINPFNNTSLEGMYRSGGVLCTQNEAEGFRKICFYPDRPDVLASFTTSLTANKEKYPILLGCGNLISEKEDDDTHTKTYYDPAPKPCYLFAAVAGKLHGLKSSFTRKSGKPVNLYIYSEDENLEKCEYAMQSLQRAMAWDEEVFGLECDLDDYKIVAVDSFNFGAMENKGLNIFNSSLIFASPETTTDNEYINIEAVIAHEYFHNWSGNRITLRDWFQLTLKEGLTVYRDQEFTSDMHSRLVKRIEDVSMLREYQFSEDAGPLSHPIQPQEYQQINNFYTLTIYEKGAEIVRMYRTLLGDQPFMEALKNYFNLYDGKAITIQEFFTVMQEMAPEDISQFKRWYHTFGTPTVNVDNTFDHQTGTLTFNLQQVIKNNPEALPLMLPLRYSVLNESGAVIQSGTHIMRNKKENIVVKNTTDAEAYISLNQGFSAPIIVQQNLSPEETARRALIETDDFNRWDLLQKTFLQGFLTWKQSNKTILHKKPVEETTALNLQTPSLENSINSITSCLKSLLKVALENGQQTHYVSQCFVVPSVRTMINAWEETNFASIKTFRENYLLQIATRLENEIYSTYEVLNEKNTAAARALKNILLAYLYRIPKKNETTSKYAALAEKQMLEAKTMTDCYTAFSLLTWKPQPQTENAIRWFYEKWHHNNLVMNKWLAAQASADSEDVISKIQLLEESPVYNINEPNKVRALLGVFAMRNFYQFHNSNGNGYRFISNKIIALDKTNPMMSSQLLTAFSHFGKLPAEQKQLARIVISEIAGSIESKHAKEIATNLLK